MADQAQKTPIARTLEQFVGRKARGAIDLLGKALPASVVKVVSSGIVTVKLEVTNTPYTVPNLTVPIAGSEYVRLPVQVGMLGWVMSADAYLGGVSGLGGGTADLSMRGNLSALVFSPIGNAKWSAADDPNALVLYGPDGVIIRDFNSKNTLNLAQNQVTLTITQGGFTVTLPGGHPMTVNGTLQVNGALQINGPVEAIGGGTYAGDFKTSGNVVAGVGGPDQVGLKTHTHGGVVVGAGTTTAPNAGT